ncbi:hypothetical protein F3Y22_tig00110387pilonHSYRG00045 [Hibiscus syriacus]|uniref:Uncharacterized protein n=1 Tax=Hibiscus syriacus TaxID=106335 RepID=A0A6A3AU02_HIBSY|nr:hypothetical protein F3Y22_tig00110387pilonHSYRG00045 [Hibiscus syriacus]
MYNIINVTTLGGGEVGWSFLDNKGWQSTSDGLIKFSPNKIDAVVTAASVGKEEVTTFDDNNPKGFDDGRGFVLFSRNSSRPSKDFGGCEFSGFDWNSGENRGIPLLIPFVPSDHVAGLGSKSTSVSSASSCDSSEDNQITADPV